MTLDTKAFGLACGIIWGIGLFAMTWWIILIEGGASGETTLIGRVYWGYKISAMGSVIGAGWAFLDGWIGGAVFAWLYNLLAAKRSTAS